MELNEFKQKIEEFKALGKELDKLGFINILTVTEYLQFSLKGFMELIKKYGLSFEVEKQNHGKYPYEIKNQDLKIFAIASASEMLKYGAIEVPENFTDEEKAEFAELKAQKLALESENKRLKEQLSEYEDVEES